MQLKGQGQASTQKATQSLIQTKCVKICQRFAPVTLRTPISPSGRVSERADREVGEIEQEVSITTAQDR